MGYVLRAGTIETISYDRTPVKGVYKGTDTTGVMAFLLEQA